jgi:hypothetical protein
MKTVSQVMDDRVESALEYLVDTDEEYARNNAYVKMAPYYLKLIKATHFLDAAGTVAERESIAFSSEEYKSWLQTLQDATVKLEIMEAKRESAQREVDIWRTISANQRK